MVRDEPELKRLKKVIGRSSESRIYLEEVYLSSVGNHSRILLPKEPEDGFTDAEIRHYAEYVLERDLERYLELRRTITGQ
jgi:hypothetical protein